MSTNRALLLSIRPNFVDAIFAKTKTVELRRVKPRLQAGDLVVIYASGATKGIVGAFEVAGVTAAKPSGIWRRHNGGSGLTKKEFDTYFAGAAKGYAIEIGRLWKHPVPVPLDTLRSRRAGFSPPQGYHYWQRDELLRVGGDGLPKRVAKLGAVLGIGARATSSKPTLQRPPKRSS
jgi:predicted transcriptional regulator